MEFNENLDYLLLPPGKVTQIGPETGKPVRDGIAVFVSGNGSHRYVLYKNGKPIGALQVMDMAKLGKQGGHAANVFVAREDRRHGVATALMEAARKDFGSVTISDDLSGSGRSWKEKVESKYALVEKMKSVGKTLVKRLLQTAIGLGILSHTALGMNLDQGKTDRLVKNMNSALQGSDVKFDAKFKGTHNKWSCSMQFIGKDGSTYTINIIHIQTASDDKYETLKAGGNKKGDDYETVKDMGSELAHKLSDKLRSAEVSEHKDEVKTAQDDEMEKRHEAMRERLGR